MNLLWLERERHIHRLMRACVFSLSLLLLAASCDDPPSSPSTPRPPTTPGLPVDIASPSRTTLFDYLRILAADSMYGRRAGSEYERDAAEWVRARFIEIGLDPGSATAYMQTFDIPFVVDGQAGLISQNVLGVLPGQGSLAGQWVVLGAHYDHVGFTEDGDGSVTVYNGADDNASGTALMLEAARVLSEYAAGDDAVGVDRRSIMFQAYGSEEVGLVGSVHFCGNPTVSMDSVTAMVNLDMVGRLRDATLGLIGLESSALWVDLVSAANKDLLYLVSVDGLMNRSDQYCFFQHGKPVLFLHTGLHDEYHTPQDDVELINGVGMVSVGKLASWVLLDLALRSQPLPFTGGLSSAPPSPGAIDLARFRR